MEGPQFGYCAVINAGVGMEYDICMWVTFPWILGGMAYVQYGIHGCCLWTCGAQTIQEDILAENGYHTLTMPLKTAFVCRISVHASYSASGVHKSNPDSNPD